ncbi:MAG: GntR family transcriptional regulator [Dongiaceae bacterium]
MSDAVAPPEEHAWREVRLLMEQMDRGLPLFRRIEAAIQAAIREGYLSPGSRLPTEKSMAALFGVSLGIAQKAMTCLAQEGIVTRARRRGTFISGRVNREDIYVFRFKDPETGAFVEPVVRILSLSIADNGPWNAFLREEKVVRFERLMRVGLEPPVYSEFFIAHEHGAHLLGLPLTPLHGTSIHRLLGERFSSPTVRVDHKVRCTVFAREVCARLMLPENSVGLLWEIGGYSYGDLPTSYQRIHLPPDHRAVEIESRFISGEVNGRGGIQNE